MTDSKTKPESPDEVHVEIKYDGPAIERGRMPVETLAPAMLGMADLLGATASMIYSDDIRLNIDVVADFQKGSFGFELAVAQMAQPETLDYGVDLIKVVGAVLGSGGIIGAVKWLKNRRIEHTEPRDDKSETLITIDGDRNTVNLFVVKLLESPRIRRHIGRVIKPLKSAGITSFDASSEKVGETHVGKDDVGAFEIPDDDTDVISDHASDQVVKITLAPLESPEHKWKFAQGEAHFWARITDEGFLERCERHKIRFGTGDSLAVELRTVTMGDPREPHYEREITKVYNILQADKPIQGDIFDSSL